MAIRIGGRIWVDSRGSIVAQRTAGIGASCPFPWVLANVPSPNPQQPFAAGNGTGAPRPALVDLLPDRPPEGKLDGGEGHEGGQGFREVLKVLGETPVASEPGEGAFHHPAARQNDEALHVVAPLDDLHAQQRHLCHPASTCQALLPPSAHMSSSQGKRRRILSRTKPALSWSWIAAEWTTTRIGSPSLSTRAWILRPFTFLPAS